MSGECLRGWRECLALPELSTKNVIQGGRWAL